MNGLFKPPAEFDFGKPEVWKDWKNRFERFRQCSKLSDENGTIQVNSLLYSMGEEAEKVFSQLTLTEAEKTDYNAVVQKLDDYFQPKVNVIHERSRFHSRNQLPGESVEAYVRALHELTLRANFADKEEAIRDRIVLGVRDQDLSRKLQLTADLTMRKAIDMARQQEAIAQQIDDQRGQTGATSAADAVTSRERHDKQPARSSPRSRSRRGPDLHGTSRGNVCSSGGPRRDAARAACASGSVPVCNRCGRQHSNGKTCPAMGKQCNKCGKRNHFQSVCRSKGQKVDAVTQDTQGDSGRVHAGERSVQTFFLGSFGTGDESCDPWQVDLNVNKAVVRFKIDTGADISVISQNIWKKMKPRPKLQAMKGKLDSPGGEVHSLGQFVAKTKWKGKDQYFRIVVIKGSHSSLLSRSTSHKMGLIQRLDETKTSAFGDIGKPVDCKPIEIALKEDATPYSISVPRRVPIPLMPKVEKELERMVEVGVIEKITEPTDWCAGMVPVLKKNGDVRICVDLKNLNRSVKREKYTLPTLEDVTHKLAGSKVYSKLDATSGFWQIPLSEKSAKLTTFMTPFGRFFFKRLPFGISLAPEIFQRTMEQILEGIEGVVCFMDDVVVCGDTKEQHDERLQRVLDRVTKAGLKLNRNKCEFNKEELIFLGHKFSQNGVEPDKAKVDAIKNMAEPENETELRRFLGMVNYLGRFVPNLSQIMHPLNALLNKDAVWFWGPDQKEAVKKLKESLISSPTLVYFEMNRETAVAADASSYGIGGVLYQKHDGEWKPVAYCSRTMSPAERRYAQIEKELLAAVHACTKFERYLVGLPEFKLYTDHRPLVPLLNKKDLGDTPIRCQRLIMRMMRFNAFAEYTPGKNLVVADTLSRSPLIEGELKSQEELESDVAVHVDAVRASWPVSDEKLAEYRRATSADINLKTALDYTRSGWPIHKRDVMLAARDLFDVKDELSEYDGILLRGDRIVIPFDLRQEVLHKIHDGHLGIEKCRERARTCVWWPGMSTDIKEKIQRCRLCVEKSHKQQKEPLIPTVLPEYPFQKVAVDLCEKGGETYMVVVDYFSRYIEVTQLSCTSSSSVIRGLKEIFARHGIPEVLVSDNGPQFSAHVFATFVGDWGISHVTSSPHHPQGNGAAERAVQTAKNLISQKDWELALLTYRATPVTGLGVSPAELAFGRKIRTRLPCIQKILIPKDSEVRERDCVVKNRQKQYFDRHHGAKPLPILLPGDTVRVMTDESKNPGWKQPGTVREKCHDRSYVIDTPSGTYRRNRKHLKKVHPEVNRNVQQARDILEDTQADTDTHTSYRHVTENMQPEPDNSVNTGQGTTVRQTRSGRIVKTPARFKD